jgi:NitT/TauT family transport system permease protein
LNDDPSVATVPELRVPGVGRERSGAVPAAKPPPRGLRSSPLGALAVFVFGLGIWALLSSLRLWPESMFPAPASVAKIFWQLLVSGRLLNDTVASLFRVTSGFLLAVVLSVPIGLTLGHHVRAREALLPAINFFRNLSPLAWIPFAILWFPTSTPLFGEDAPVVFLIFVSAFFPMALAVAAAVASIPSVYFQVARDYGIRGWELLTSVTLPAIMPQFITTLRVASGVAWLVVVAAEMVAGDQGLGFAVWDSRNGLRTDMLVAVMLVIGSIGVVMDWLLFRLTRLPEVRWGYER